MDLKNYIIVNLNEEEYDWLVKHDYWKECSEQYNGATEIPERIYNEMTDYLDTEFLLNEAGIVDINDCY